MVFSEATYLPQPHIRPVLRLVTEVPGLRSIFTQPVERVTVQNTPLPNAYISDRLYTTDLTHKKDRTVDPDMVMVGPSLRLGGLFPLRLDTERLGELYNELERENTLFITRKGLFFVDGTDRNEKDLRFDEARFSLFQDKDGFMRQQEQGREPVYLYDEHSDMVEYVRHLKTIEYKGMEREVFVSIRFASSFFEMGASAAALNGIYDPHAVRKSLSYTYSIL
ncbi:MAG: hypothetical protein WAZ50_02390 [Minisyncoccia bacterium]